MSSKKKLPGNQLTILNFLKNADGPVSIKAIKKITGLTDRQVKETIEVLIFNYDMPIVAKRSKGGGYYIAKNKKELSEGLKQYIKQIRTSELRVKKLMSIEF